MEKELMYVHLAELRERFGEDTVMISLAEAARYLRMAPRTLLEDSKFPKRHIGKRDLVPLINLARWLS